MLRTALITGMIIATLGLTACSDAPSCADERVASTLIPIIVDKFSYQGGLNKYKAADVILERYRVISHNEHTGLLMCEAEINHQASGEKIRRVRYEVQRYQDKPTELYIAIEGGFLYPN